MNSTAKSSADRHQYIRNLIITIQLWLVCAAHSTDSISIKTIRYPWGGIPAATIVVKNESAAKIDSATIRVLIEADDTVGTHFKPAYRRTDTLPMSITDAIGVRLDICIHIDSNNYSSPCDNSNDWVTSSSWSTTNMITQLLAPTRYPGKRNIWAIDIPLIGITIQKGETVRFGLMLANRSAYPSVFTSSQYSLMQTAQLYIPEITIPRVGDTGWAWSSLTDQFSIPINIDSTWGLIQSSHVLNQAKVDSSIDTSKANRQIILLRKGNILYGKEPSSEVAANAHFASKYISFTCKNHTITIHSSTRITEKNAHLTIYNMSGNMVFATMITPNAQTPSEIMIPQRMHGIHIIRVRSGTTSFIQQLYLH